MSRANGALQGGCVCRAVRYRLHSAPLFVHCCHCTWCQRETGSAFAVNALIEADRVELLGEAPEAVRTPSASGKGQVIWRCPTCRVAVWSNYAGSGSRIHFVRVGTLDAPHDVRPDIHIYTSTKRPWVMLPEGVPAMPEFYKAVEHWPPESMARWQAAKQGGRG